jgi:hypothetical protein
MSPRFSACAIVVAGALGCSSDPEPRGEAPAAETASAANEFPAKPRSAKTSKKAPREPAPEIPGPEGEPEPEGGPEPAPKVASREAKAPPEDVRKPAARPKPRAPEVADILIRLQATPEEAGKAYRQIWEAPRSLIPKLIPEVSNDAPSALRELTILVLDRDFAQVDAKDNTVVYDIPGMGKIKYDDIVVGKAPRGLKVLLRRLERPFPVGAVVRAGLINRFRSTDYPGGSDASDPVGWWQRFHDRVRAKL